ncbi:putative surface protease GP63 [Trypanosoma theileri]|uniref:Leishmanolysin-like peptidase n=1 Tax=Trypanosoma theileri TaxID=67003 RepID=A0A1X0NXI6_9TRYP|nr:putative surface protease GP63 [Trypanosoma theileri]ORC89407.1 putative surface protease GP63 [Trypanosoma theileri]
MVPVFDGDQGMGIPNADFVIYLGLSTKKPGTKICTYGDDGRPTSAMIKLNPFEIKYTQQYVRLVAHEIAHGLGFSMDLDKFRQMVLNGENSSYPGYKELSSPEVKNAVQDHYICDDYIGMKLDNSPPETGRNDDPHFDGRVARDELMAPLHGVTGDKRSYSSLTLAAFESTGYYKADYNKAEKFWGSKMGCKFLKKP